MLLCNKIQLGLFIPMFDLGFSIGRKQSIGRQTQLHSDRSFSAKGYSEHERHTVIQFMIMAVTMCNWLTRCRHARHAVIHFMIMAVTNVYLGEQVQTYAAWKASRAQEGARPHEGGWQGRGSMQRTNARPPLKRQRPDHAAGPAVTSEIRPATPPLGCGRPSAVTKASKRWCTIM